MEVGTKRTTSESSVVPGMPGTTPASSKESRTEPSASRETASIVNAPRPTSEPWKRREKAEPSKARMSSLAAATPLTVAPLFRARYRTGAAGSGVAVGVAVGGTGVAVGGTGVLVAVGVGGSGVGVGVAGGGVGVLVGVGVGGGGVLVGVAVGGTGVLVDVAVGGTGVSVAVAVGEGAGPPESASRAALASTPPQ